MDRLNYTKVDALEVVCSEGGGLEAKGGKPDEINEAVGKVVCRAQRSASTGQLSSIIKTGHSSNGRRRGSLKDL